MPSPSLDLKTFEGRARALELAHMRLERESDPEKIKCRAAKLRTLRESCRAISRDQERQHKNRREKDRIQIEKDRIEVEMEQNELARELLEQLKSSDKSDPFASI